jgi:hypothetical protein
MVAATAAAGRAAELAGLGIGVTLALGRASVGAHDPMTSTKVNTRARYLKVR